MIITYTNPKSAANAIQAFPASDWVIDYQKRNVILTLNYFYSKENKIYVSGLKDNNEKAIREAF